MSNKMFSLRVDNKSEYVVEFECYSKLRVNFEEVSGLNQSEIVERAKGIAIQTFERDGLLITERIARDHSYSITSVGIDSSSANILNPTETARTHLKIVPSK